MKLGYILQCIPILLGKSLNPLMFLSSNYIMYPHDLSLKILLITPVTFPSLVSISSAKYHVLTFLHWWCNQDLLYLNIKAPLLFGLTFHKFAAKNLGWILSLLLVSHFLWENFQLSQVQSFRNINPQNYTYSDLSG